MNVSDNLENRLVLLRSINAVGVLFQLEKRQLCLFVIIQRNNSKMVSKHHLHTFNPDWEQATRHAQAHRPGIFNPDSTNLGEQHFCHCCGEPIAKEPVGLWGHSKELQFLGFGFPLFYEFLKYCIILLIINIGCYAAISLQQAVQNNRDFCFPIVGSGGKSESTTTDTPTTETTTTKEVAHKCYTFMIDLARIQDHGTSEELTIRCVSFAVHLLALIYIRNLMTKLEMYYDQRSTTLSDYSIVIKGINKPDGGVRKSIMSFMTREMSNDIPTIEQIIVLPHFQKIQQLKKQRDNLIKQIRPLYKRSKPQNEQKLVQMEKQLKKINDQFVVQANQSYNLIRQDKLGCERVIVVFSTEADKERALQTINKKSNQQLAAYFGPSCRIKIDEAPNNPEQVIWANFNLPKRKRIIRTIFGWLLSLVVLVAVFIVFYFILVEKSKLLEHAGEKLAEYPDDQTYQTEYRGAVALVFVLMFLVVLFDKLVLSTLFHHFTQLELPSTTATLQFSFALKLSIGLFFTTAIMTLATQAIKFGNYYSHPYGVVDEETIMFFMNSFFIPFFWLVNPMRIFKLIKRKCSKGRKDLTQYEANKLMEDEAYDLGKRFAEVIQTMWFVFLYSTLIPIGGVIAVFGLTLYYWIDKYNLLRRSKIHGKVSGSYLRTSLILLDITLILRPIGSIIFDLHLRGDAYKTSNIVLICVAFAFIIFPKNYLIKLLNSENFKLESKTYREAKDQFHSNYHTNHPLFGILKQDEIEKQNLVHKMRSINSLWSPLDLKDSFGLEKQASIQSGTDLLRNAAE